MIPSHPQKDKLKFIKVSKLKQKPYLTLTHNVKMTYDLANGEGKR